MAEESEELSSSGFVTGGEDNKHHANHHLHRVAITASTVLQCSLKMANIPTELCKIIIDGYYRQPQTNSTIQSCMRILMTRATTDDEKHQTVLLQYGPIFDWNTTAVTNMHGLCGYPNFNEPIDDWDVSNVTDILQSTIH